MNNTNELTNNMMKRNAGTNKLMEAFKEAKAKAQQENTLMGELELQMYDEPLKFVHAVAKDITVAVQSGQTMAETANVSVAGEHQALQHGRELLKRLMSYKNESQQDYLRNTKSGMFNVPFRREQAERALAKYKEMDMAIVELQQALAGKHPLNRERVQYNRAGVGAVTPLSYK